LHSRNGSTAGLREVNLIAVEAASRELGVRRVSMPNHSSKSPQRRLLERKRWFREAQRWRTGCEGRIGLLKRRHGLDRCRYKGEDGMKRWVGPT
jgi:IS5 family transposase